MHSSHASVHAVYTCYNKTRRRLGFFLIFFRAAPYGAGGSESAVAATATSADIDSCGGPPVPDASDAFDVSDEKSKKATPTRSKTREKHRRKPTGLGAGSGTSLKFDEAAARREIARGKLASAEEKLSKVKVRTVEVDAMQRQLHELQSSLYQPVTP